LEAVFMSADADLAEALGLIGELQGRVAALEAERARDHGRRIGQQRADAARLMGSAQWSAVYGAPQPGLSRPLAAAALARQRAAGARVYGQVPGGPGFQATADADPAEERRWR
jgi:hypothetical protein